MGNFYESINDDLATWIRKQHMFFCATAPISAQGTVNTSPKGVPPESSVSLVAVFTQELTPRNSKPSTGITLILSPVLHYLQTTTMVKTPSLSIEPPKSEGSSLLISIKSGPVAAGLPYYEFKGERPTLKSFWGKKSREQLGQYWRMANTSSLDGLPGLRHELMGPEWAPTAEDGYDDHGQSNKKDSPSLSSALVSHTKTLLGSSALIAVGFSAGLAASVFL
ncbi:hypothetical protein BGZ83_011220 [Gryganskiella cystojenkinii]|nr:hypothetical protein BGZ83_011220 [Gryganskiella cystojenkinii]